MTDNDQPESLVLRMLRSMDTKLDILSGKVDALQQHSFATGETLLALRKDIQQLEVRMARVETRLDLRDAARA